MKKKKMKKKKTKKKKTKKKKTKKKKKKNNNNNNQKKKKVQPRNLTRNALISAILRYLFLCLTQVLGPQRALCLR